VGETRMGEHETVKITVYLDEEHGYRYWKWETGMEGHQLVAWWEEIPTMEPYFHDIKKLPGTLEELSWLEPEKMPMDVCAEWRAHVHMDNDSILIFPSILISTGHPWTRGTATHKGYMATPFVTHQEDSEVGI